jgi:hypothetical protein
MDDITYTKGLYTATAKVRQLQDGHYQGVVSLTRDDATELHTNDHEAVTTSSTEGEALEEAKALAHRLLGEIEF